MITIRTAAACAASVAVAATVVPAPVAVATPGRDVSAIVLSQATRDGQDFVVRDITIAPGGSTGWHWHQGRLFGQILAGTLTHNRADCSVDGVYETGATIIETGGPDNVHIGRNLGTTAVVLRVLYINPAAAPLSDDAPDPGCGFN